MLLLQMMHTGRGKNMKIIRSGLCIAKTNPHQERRA